MDDVRRKVLLDLFAAPGTVLPIAVGLTMLMASWAVNGSAWLNFGGVVGILGGIGWFASRLILGLNKITNRAYEMVVDRQRNQQEEALEQLDAKLVKDRDPRTQNCLRELRHLHTSLQKRIHDGTEVSPAAFEIMEGVKKLFTACIHQLEHSHTIWETAKELQGSAREQLLQQRDEMVQEVCDSVVHLANNVENFHMVTAKKNNSELRRLRSELDETIQVARRVEERTENLSKTRVNEATQFE